jgi:putative nucleotidyltransferase with HDIG domain
MSNGNQPRTRSDLVAGLRLPRGQLARMLDTLRRGDVLVRLSLCLVAAIVMWATTSAWAPRFAFRAGYTPPRDIIARDSFSKYDPVETANRRRTARNQALCVYIHNRQPLIEIRAALKDSVFQIINAESFGQLQQNTPKVWAGFSNVEKDADEENEERLFSDFREALADDAELARFERALQGAFSEFERDGLLVTLEHELDEGSQVAIQVLDIGNPASIRRVEARDVHLNEVMAKLEDNLERELKIVGIAESHLETAAHLIFTWITNEQLPTTLEIDSAATNVSREEAARRIEDATIDYNPGDLLIVGGQPLTKENVDLLRLEYRSLVKKMSLTQLVRHSIADLGMFCALYVLCGTYIFFHHRPLALDLRRLATILALVTIAVTMCVLTSSDQWRSELVPLVLFGITVTIAYSRELALLLAAAVALVVTLSLGQGLADFVILVAAMSASILLLGRIRSRTKLIYVGLGAAAVVALTAIGVGTLTGQSYGWSGLSNAPFDAEVWIQDSFLLRLILGAAWFGFCTFLAGILMTGLLPFIERLFDVQTDLSLLELGDVAHPLLQELVHRAPGTYNHSITVASIAEAAADAIGANGLLVRVGAYFHDIGKMLKPGYFVENQGGQDNRHDSLVPAMSTLVIIAHVKDGADLARQHHLPRSIVDFIEQHHGTTLVEYFYRAAAKQSEEDPDSSEVDESSFRYPGPTPRTRESGVLMLADASESICRTLVDPAPARIEHVVRDLVMKRLLDNQFDECGLTLRELHTIEESLVKSLTAVYHGRVKYPSQQQPA